MKNNSQHPKPEDGEKRKLKKPVICYPNETIKIDRWSDYQVARKDLDKIKFYKKNYHIRQTSKKVDLKTLKKFNSIVSFGYRHIIDKKIIKKLKNEAENNIFFPRFVFILTFPAVNNPDNAPNPAEENIRPNK